MSVRQKPPIKELTHQDLEFKVSDRFSPEPPDIKESEGDSQTPKEAKRWAYKNVIGISLGFLLVFTAFLGLQNLQSSINSSGGVGLASLAILYGFWIISGFFTPGFLKLLGTKYALLTGFACHFIYSLANYYPGWYTLIPASILIGLFSGPVWASASSHIVEVALTVAPILAKDRDHLISKFTGIFFFMFQFAQIPGNLASSLIFFPYSGINDTLTLNSTSCGHSSSGNDFDLKFLYILVSVYLLFISMGILSVFLMVDVLPTNNRFLSTGHKVKFYLMDPIIDLAKVLKNLNMILIAPMSVFNGIEMSFTFGVFTQVFIADCFGTYQVGFTLIVYGISTATMSVVSGRIVRYIPRLSVFVIGATINIALIVLLLIWNVTPSYIIIFVFAVLWGASDGIWNTMVTSLVGILFSDNLDPAYSAQRIWLAVGFTIGFIAAELLIFKHFLIILLVLVFLALACAFIVEIKTQSKESLLPCCYWSSRFPVNTSTSDVSGTVFTSTGKENGGHKKQEATREEMENPLFLIYDERPRRVSLATNLDSPTAPSAASHVPSAPPPSLATTPSIQDKATTMDVTVVEGTSVTIRTDHLEG